MATPIKRIEKDFLLKTLFDDQTPVMYFSDRTEYILRMDRPPKTDVSFKVDRPITGLKPGRRLDLMFDYRGQVISFVIEISDINGVHITAPIPEYLYKNLDRSYSRVSTPTDLHIQFTFQGDRYSLHYPKVREYEKGEIGAWINTTDPKNLQGIIEQMAVRIRGFASGYKMVIFKDVKPDTTEERVIAETGKTLFLPSTTGNFPQADPYPKKRLITEETFRRYLESTGVSPAFMDNAVSRFIKQKLNAGFYSDAWVPILFQEYVIGYIHVWINVEGKPPFDYNVVETLYQFGTILAYSLKTKGYFNEGRIKNEPFEGKIMDISASGLLFAYPHSALSGALLPDSELAVKLFAPKRKIEAIAKIVRRYKDNTMGYFGCRFLNMAPEDMRFLFEYLYGKAFSDSEAALVTGQV
ncbi:MAG: PilZ domain-containing protein [Spirochaetaceae bacterium]|jgi:c-di-GMP-binding flagellar brake protein YcgR|nr:PilZ domain-containing protein [Spirochaetaceae bacterium]